jgi:hypothetical protein
LYIPRPAVKGSKAYRRLSNLLCKLGRFIPIY